MSWLDLQNCEPGWGFDCKTGLFVPINSAGNLETAPIQKTFRFYYKSNPFDPQLFLNYDDVAYWIINENPNFYKYMEFCSANCRTCEFAFRVWGATRQITAKKSDNYPTEATHFVEKVNYGLEMFILFDKKNSRLFAKNGRNEFLEKVWEGEQKLTKEQENAECSVLIFAKNPEETTVKQMKFSQVLQFFEDFKNEKHPEYGTVINCWVTELTERISVFNENFWRRFVIIGKKCFESIRRLQNPEHKNLIEKEQQTDDIIGNTNQMDSQTIIMDKNSMFTFKREILQRLKLGLLFLNNVDEPYTWNNSLNKKVLLGFAVNQSKFIKEKVELSNMFVSACPEECTNDDRQWICMNCGNFFKEKNHKVVCDCGTTHVTKLKLECCNSKHKKSSIFREIESEKLTNITDGQKSILVTIKQQLQKRVNQGNATSIKEINSVIQSIDSLDESLVDQLRTLAVTNLDGDTTCLINNFLDQF